MYETAKTIVQPYTVLMLLTGCTLLYIWMKRDVGRKPLLLLTILWIAMFAISSLGVTSAMLASLRSQYPPPARLPEDADVIVTLGGGLKPVAQFRDRPELDGVSFGRCLHTAAIYRLVDGCTVIVCGGTSRDAPNGPTVGEVMRDTLVRLGVDEDNILVEVDSLTTYENARNATKILEDRKLKKVMLVTDARHMPRSVLCFEKFGVQVVPVPSDYSLKEPAMPWYEAVLPTVEGLGDATRACHEWLGMGWYWFHGRI